MYVVTDRIRGAWYGFRHGFNGIFRDPLTGALDRKLVREELADKLIERAIRYRQPLSLIMIDLDDFKELNDKNGHSFGDRVLRNLASTVIELIRKSDFFCRYGGDEFLLVLPGTKKAGAEILMSRIAVIVEPVSFSYGIVDLIAGETAEDLIDRADEKLYFQKKAKKANKRKVRGG